MSAPTNHLPVRQPEMPKLNQGHRWHAVRRLVDAFGGAGVNSQLFGGHSRHSEGKSLEVDSLDRSFQFCVLDSNLKGTLMWEQ
jgi:hypothetical protein